MVQSYNCIGQPEPICTKNEVYRLHLDEYRLNLSNLEKRRAIAPENISRTNNH